MFYSELFSTRNQISSTRTKDRNDFYRVVWSDKTETDEGKGRQEITCTSNIASGLTIYPVFSLRKSATLILFLFLASLHSDWRSSLSENCEKLAFVCQNLICMKLMRSNLLLSWNKKRKDSHTCKSGTSKYGRQKTFRVKFQLKCHQRSKLSTGQPVGCNVTNNNLPLQVSTVSQCLRPNHLFQSTWLWFYWDLDCKNESIFLVSPHLFYSEISQATTAKK